MKLLCSLRDFTKNEKENSILTEISTQYLIKTKYVTRYEKKSISHVIVIEYSKERSKNILMGQKNKWKNSDTMLTFFFYKMSLKYSMFVI